MDNKKISLLVLFSLLFVVGFFGLTSAVSSGTWTTSPLQSGTWSETFNGVEGNAGAILNAIGNGGQWNLTGLTSGSLIPPVPFASGSNYNIYETPYTLGTFNLSSGPWGNGFTIPHVNATIFANKTTDLNLNTSLLFFNTTYNGYFINVSASATETSPNNGTGHSGTVDSISLSIINMVPNISNLYINPIYPNSSSESVTVYANITDSFAPINYTTLYYKIGDNSLQQTNFSSPYFGHATISDPNPNRDGILVQYYLQSVDILGGSYQTPLFNFTYDGSAPITSDNANSVWTNQNVQIILSCLDSISGCNTTFYSVNSSSYNTYLIPFTLTNTGTYQLSYYSIDNAGNKENPKIGTLVNIDKIAPTISDNYILNGTWTNLSQTVILSPADLGGSEVASVYYCTGITCNPTTGTLLSPPYILSFTTSQNKTIRYQAFDNAGNPSAIGQFNVLIDKIIPATTDNVPSQWQNLPFTVTLTSFNNGFSPVTTYYKDWLVGGVEPTTYMQGNSILISTDGQYNIKYYSIDGAGNIETPEIAPNIAKLDTINPIVAINPVTSPTNLTTQTITGTFTETNLVSIMVNSVFVTTFANGTYSANVPLSSDGSNAIIVTATDSAGNIGTASTSVIRDTVAPTLSIISNSTTDNIDYFTIESNSADVGGSGVNQVNLALINSTGAVVDTGLMSNVPSTTNYDYMLPMWNLTTGNYTINVTSTDNAGNMKLISNNITVQNNLAPTQIITINGLVNASTGGNVSFVFNLISRNSAGQIRFGMDNIAGLTPSTLNATISNGTTSVPVGNSAFVGSQLLTMSNLQTIAPGVVSGTFTLSLTLPANMTVGTYPVNYYINNA